jgi:hypothetical protein
MTDLDIQIQQFFHEYEKANAEFDVQKIAACCAEVFFFAGPAGIQVVRKEDFVKVLPRRKEFFRSSGLVSSEIANLEISALDSRYILTRAAWRMRFERGAAEPLVSENFATYILSLTDDGFEIVFQIDHQDLAKKVAELGLQ